jgi:NADH dehydrogenase FAD-containing subunit
MESNLPPPRPPASKEPLNIVVLGGSFAGLSASHNFLRKTIDELGITRSAPRYRVVLVSPSTHLFWNIGAPRSIVSSRLIPHTKSFIPILDAFRDYPKNRFTFIQGSAVGVDFIQRNVTISVIGDISSPVLGTNARRSHETKGGGSVDASARQASQTIPYHALIIATGTSAESPLLSLHGPHEKTIAALDTFHSRLRDASSIIIAGGGPSGVECAGQLATFANKNSGKTQSNPKSPSDTNFQGSSEKRMSNLSSIFKSRTTRATSTGSNPTDSKPNRKTIFLVSGNDRLLTKLPASIGEKAEKKLKRLGVTVTHNVRLLSAQELPSGVTRCVLSGDLSLNCDLFIAATGVHPNSQFLPPELLDASGYISASSQYLRVDRAGDRVYAIGDCASYSKNNIMDVYDSIPVLLQNLENDLLTFELKAQYPFGGAEDQLDKLKDWRYVQNPMTSQLIPITRYGGVGVLFGFRVPSLMVWLMKGRDYRISKAELAAKAGHNPYAPDTYVYK